MNPLFLAIVLQTPTPANQVMQRLRAYVHQAHSMTATFTLTSPQVKTTGKAVLYYVRPDRACYTFKWDVGPMVDYRFVGNDKGSWDANYQSRFMNRYYDESQEYHFDYPESNISAAISWFTPGFLMDGTLRCAPVSQPTYVGKAQINGVSTDEVEARGAVDDIKLYIAQDGKPVRFDVNHGGKFEVVADPSSIVLNQPINPSLFGYSPPVGFTEYEVPLPTRPAPVGRNFPLIGWSPKDRAGALTAENTLIMVTTPGCLPSARAATALRDLVSKGIHVILISNTSSGGVPGDLKGYPVLTDPSGKLLKNVDAPGTPLFYVLNKSGVVVKIWYGYDPDQAAKFEKDVLQTTKTRK